MATTGERIRAARIRAGMTQAELAAKVGVKYSAIHKYESGLVVNLKRETIFALAKALNVRPSYLMCVDQEELPEEVVKADEDIVILSRAAKKMAPEDRQKLIEMAKVMFGDAFK